MKDKNLSVFTVPPKGVSWVEWRYCKRKTPFKKKSTARKIASKYKGYSRIYRCRYCGNFHLTSSKSKNKGK